MSTDEPSGPSVFLPDYAGKTLPIIKAVRQWTGLDLMAAKKQVDLRPCVVPCPDNASALRLAEDLSEEMGVKVTATTTKHRCEDCGAKAEEGSRLCIACQAEPPVVGWSAEETPPPSLDKFLSDTFLAGMSSGKTSFNLAAMLTTLHKLGVDPVMLQTAWDTYSAEVYGTEEDAQVPDDTKFGEGLLQKMKRAQDMIYAATKQPSLEERVVHEARYGLPWPLLAASPEVLKAAARIERYEPGAGVEIGEGTPDDVDKKLCQEDWTDECEGATCSQCGFCPTHAYEANRQGEGKCIHCEEKKPDPFKPDWVSPPGHTLRDWMKEQKISTRRVQTKLRLVEWDLDYLLDGTLAITYELAYRLGKLTLVSTDFWLNREDDYRKVPRRSEMV